jgi:hypothetical protein
LLVSRCDKLDAVEEISTQLVTMPSYAFVLAPRFAALPAIEAATPSGLIRIRWATEYYGFAGVLAVSDG